MKIWQILLSAVFAIAVVGCTNNSPNVGVNASTTGDFLTGTVNFNGNNSLPDNAMVTVTLADISDTGKPANVLSQIVFPAAGKQAPFVYALPYAASQVQSAKRIMVTASISLNGQIIYANKQVHEVLTNGIKQAEIDLVAAK